MTTPPSIAPLNARESITVVGILIAVVAFVRGFTHSVSLADWLVTNWDYFVWNGWFFAYIGLVILAIVMCAVALLAALLRHQVFAAIALVLSALILDIIAESLLWFINSLIDGWEFTFNLPGAYIFAEGYFDLATWATPFYVVSAFSFYVATIVGILGLIVRPQRNPAARRQPGVPTAQSSAGASPSPSASAAMPGPAPLAEKPAPAKAKKASTALPWELVVPGAPDTKADFALLASWAQAGVLKPDSPVREVATGVVFTARQIPGLFSDKSYVTALLLSIFLGGLGIDRFYTGHVGLGIGKLLTAGGCGVWSLIDLILYALRKVNDVNGRPLS